MKFYHCIFIFCLIAAVYACTSSQNKDADRDTTVNHVTSYNNLFLDSNKLQQFLNAHAEFKEYNAQFNNFYKERNYEYAWFDSSGIGEQAKGFVNLLNNTINNLQDSSLYNPALLKLYNDFVENDEPQKHNYDEVLNTELTLTGQFFKYAKKIYNGTDSNITDLGWFIPRKKINLTALLDSVIVSKNGKADDYANLNQQYIKLREFLPFYFKLQKEGNWDSIPKPVKALHINKDTSNIVIIKDRLHRLGDLAVNDSTPYFDSALFKAVKSFQKRMGLEVDGTIGAKFIQELNVTPAQRVQQILVNLERMRWMPPQKDSEYIFVNIPEYKMYVYNDGKIDFTMNVIVGTAANSTTIFSGDLKYVVFAPYWRVPVKIVRTEILPAMKKDPNYLVKNNMERTGGPDTLPTIRQKPGPMNALGRVKFLFPNNYDIYFHDTPNHDLFSASNRSFSHGCIRLSEPKKFAQFLLRNDTSWNETRIDTCMQSTTERWVSLKKTVPVQICYFTAFVDDNGILNFRKDIYKHDQEIADKLFAKQ